SPARPETRRRQADRHASGQGRTDSTGRHAEHNIRRQANARSGFRGCGTEILNSQALSGTDALITGDATVKNSGGKLSSNGNIQLQKPRIKNVDVGYPI